MSETMISSDNRSRLTGRLVFGLVIVVLGILFTLDNLGLVDSGEALRYWPVVLVLFGLTRLLGIGARRHLAMGVIFTLLGSWLLVHEFGLTSWEPWDFWPVFLVVLGFSMVRGSLARQARSTPGGGEESSDTINAFALWSGVGRKITSQQFRGGEVTAIMGGHEIDLRGARLAGDSAEIDLFVWWGGVDLRIPEDWKVTLNGVVIMGGMDDQTKAPPPGTPRPNLILKGLVLMGGVELKN